MKNYRERINVCIFSGNTLVASIDGDHIQFDGDGHVFLFRDKVIVAHFPKGVWDKAKLCDKWIKEWSDEIVSYFNYWIEY